MRSDRTKAARGAASGARLARATLATLLAVGLGVFHIWSRTRVVTAGYTLGALQGEHTKLISEHDRLRIEVETLRAPRSLEEFARNKLGMAPPDVGPVLVAGPRPATAGAGWAGVDGVGHRAAPAEPALFSNTRGRAAAGPTAEPGERYALRGPLRAGRAPVTR
jgi:cell division protein FtsL